MVRNAKKKSLIRESSCSLYPILLAFFLSQVMSQFSEQYNSDKK